MEKYTRVKKEQDFATPKADNEVRILVNGKMRDYITEAQELLQEKGLSTITLKAMGRAINKTVAIVEIVKRNIPGLHQITETSSVSITDTWEPKEEGLTTLEVTRNMSALTVTLSKTSLDTKHPGYQPPLPADQVVPIREEEIDEMEAGEANGGALGVAGAVAGAAAAAVAPTRAMGRARVWQSWGQQRVAWRAPREAGAAAGGAGVAGAAVAGAAGAAGAAAVAAGAVRTAQRHQVLTRKQGAGVLACVQRLAGIRAGVCGSLYHHPYWAAAAAE
eukprot:CAMPEP_0202857678 /NCGR_PEP_ID=MMETSP1391-20130828/525_1 /ASSEMBLY_ACC=CAM_ASM_000867 /TAXON_ID=1034604 /ORGANISM="Chlamydomonas leiostraca, Strain SAG 11-49" /LENGTH=275 /DNA_ID=CAMNT_0049536509 /DNA_START=101 /DNA_END=929 /DNA_ORIENTATION=+